MEIVHNEFINQEINRQKDGNIILNTFKDEILFKNVEFNYDNNKKPVLESISIIIPSKSSIAIVGGSGAGKTSLVDLITLTNHPNKGDLLIDGVSHNQIKKSTWRNQIGYVSQDTIIFDDTIANNISMWQS